MYVQNIFLADDDHEDVQFFKDAVREISEAINVTHKPDGEELMNCLTNGEADCDTDVVFLDLNMPKMSGYDCIAALKAHSALRHLPVVIISTSNDPNNIKRLYDMGAHHYIIKPYSYGELRNVLHKVLEIDLRSSATRCDFADFLVY